MVEGAGRRWRTCRGAPVQHGTSGVSTTESQAPAPPEAGQATSESPDVARARHCSACATQRERQSQSLTDGQRIGETLSRRAMFERAQHVHGVSDQWDACIRARGDCERFPCTWTFLCLRGSYANLQACTTHVHGFFLDFPRTLNASRQAKIKVPPQPSPPPYQ